MADEMNKRLAAKGVGSGSPVAFGVDPVPMARHDGGVRGVLFVGHCSSGGHDARGKEVRDGKHLGGWRFDGWGLDDVNGFVIDSKDHVNGGRSRNWTDVGWTIQGVKAKDVFLG